MKNKLDKSMLKFGVVLTLSLCIYSLFEAMIQKWSTISGVLDKLASALAPFVVGLVLAFLLNPIMVYIRKGIAGFCKKVLKVDYKKAYKHSKTPALILTIVVFIGALGGFLWLVIPKIYESLKDLVTNMPGYMESAQAFVEKLFSKNETVEGYLNNVIQYVQDNIWTIVEDTIVPNMDTLVINISSGVVVGVTSIFNFLVGLIFAVYLLSSKHVLLAQGKKFIYLFFSKKTGNKILEGLSYANSVFGGFINGKIIDSIIIGFMCFAFTAAIEMKYAVLISVIVGVTNIIPFFGPFIGAIPGCLLALMESPTYFIIFLIFVILLQQFDGNILGPLILGDSTGLSGMWVLVAILVFGDLFGVPGMILGVPVFACIYAFIAVMLRDGLRKKELSSKTEDYLLLAGFDEETGKAIYHDEHDVRKTIKQKKKKTKKLWFGKIDADSSEELETDDKLDIKDAIADDRIEDESVLDSDLADNAMSDEELNETDKKDK